MNGTFENINEYTKFEFNFYKLLKIIVMKQILLGMIAFFCVIFTASSQSIDDPFFEHVSYRGAFGIC